ncbi:hypothetical protein MSPP1_002744 [Malassezia sp. CBS 17886]|nr:hypothetical protein MSPP1_002744 [Malassezia sp. CBS 17886]
MRADTGASEKVLYAQIKALTFYKGRMTTARRLPPVPQMTCEGSLCSRYEPRVVQCIGRGDGQWKCEAEMPAWARLGAVEVSCEGWKNAHDKYVLKGSCALTYEMLPTGKQPHGGWASALFQVLFWSLFAFIALSFLYSCIGAWRRGDRDARANGPPDGPPPPYQPGAPPPPSKGDTGWRPGFWSGLGLGAVGSRMLDPRRSRGWGSGYGNGFTDRPWYGSTPSHAYDDRFGDPGRGASTSGTYTSSIVHDVLTDPVHDIAFEDATMNKTRALALLQGQIDVQPSREDARDADAEWEHGPTYELVRVTPAESYICKMPPPRTELLEPEKQDALRDARVLRHALDILTAMNETCLLAFEKYFVYRFCFEKKIMQLAPSHDISVLLQDDVEDHVAYVLGVWRNQLGLLAHVGAARDVATFPASTGHGTATQSSLRKEGNELYLSQVWNDGTVCDLTGLPRSTEVRPAFAELEEVPVAPVRCRLVTPDDSDDRARYLSNLKEQHRHSAHHHDHEDSFMDWLDEPLGVADGQPVPPEEAGATESSLAHEHPTDNARAGGAATNRNQLRERVDDAIMRLQHAVDAQEPFDLGSLQSIRDLMDWAETRDRSGDAEKDTEKDTMPGHRARSSDGDGESSAVQGSTHAPNGDAPTFRDEL